MHEKAHFLWEHLFDDQLKQDWIDLGGWYENPDDEDGWSTTKQLEFASAYAHGKNPNEDMAESISYYIVTPDKLRSRVPGQVRVHPESDHARRPVHLADPEGPDLPGLTISTRTSSILAASSGWTYRWEGEPEEDKQITFELEIHQSGDRDSAQGIGPAGIQPKGDVLRCLALSG